METVVIDYGSGNLRSAAKAIERAARETGTDTTVTVTGDAAALDRADHIVLPGVGAFGDCAAGLRALPGMIAALDRNPLAETGRPWMTWVAGQPSIQNGVIELTDRPGFGLSIDEHNLKFLY